MYLALRYIPILDILFSLITTFIKVHAKIFQLKGLKPNNNGHTNFNECCDLTKKVYLKYVMEHFSFQIGENEVRQQIGPPSIQRLYKEGREAKLEESGVGNSSEIKSLCLMK